METNKHSLDLTNLSIPGMHCAGCARTVEKVVHQVTGVHVAKADFQRKVLEVAGSAPEADLVAAVARAGYEAEIATDALPALDANSSGSKCCCG